MPWGKGNQLISSEYELSDQERAALAKVVPTINDEALLRKLAALAGVTPPPAAEPGSLRFEETPRAARAGGSATVFAQEVAVAAEVGAVEVLTLGQQDATVLTRLADMSPDVIKIGNEVVQAAPTFRAIGEGLLRQIEALGSAVPDWALRLAEVLSNVRL